MACNYLVKMRGENKFKLMIIEGCGGSRASMAANKLFRQKYPLIKVRDFPEKVKTINRFAVVKYIEGACEVEEEFELSIGSVRGVRDNTKPLSEENFMEYPALVAKSVKVTHKLLPFFADEVSDDSKEDA